MKSAYYGRMRLGRCVRMNMGYIGCEEDVLDLADQRCSGRNECKIKVPDTNFERTQPCFELKSYLEIEYTCMKSKFWFNSILTNVWMVSAVVVLNCMEKMYTLTFFFDILFTYSVFCD